MARVTSRRSDLARALADSGSPIYVLDVGRRVVGCNPATLAWLECAGDELIGQRCDYHSSADDGAARVSQIAASLCPPPEVFAGERRRACLGVTAADGRLKWRWADFVPLVLDGEGGAVMAVLDAEDSDPNVDLRADTRGSSRTHEHGLHERLRQFRHAAAERFSLDRLVGASPWIERARAQAVMASRGRESVLIVGPTGSGKEHLAKAIHYARAGGGGAPPATAMLAVVSGADADLELFQSVVAPLLSRPGVGEGTAPATLLVLDSDQLAAEIQAELQRLIGKGSLGAATIATATRPLVELAPAGRFRLDLACSLGTIAIELPALAKRPEDVPLLAQALLESVNARGGKQVSGFTSEALDWLAMHEWLGNVDELAEAIEGAHGHAAGPQVTLSDLPRTIHLAADAARHPRRVDEPIELKTFLHQVERELITRALERAKGNKSKAARLLGLTRPRLYRRMVQLGLE